MAEPRSEYTGKEMGNGAAQVPQNRFLIKIFCQKRAETISSEKREKKHYGKLCFLFLSWETCKQIYM